MTHVFHLVCIVITYIFNRKKKQFQQIITLYEEAEATQRVRARVMELDRSPDLPFLQLHIAAYKRASLG